METTADRHKNLALEYVTKAVEQLSEIVINRASGYDDYNYTKKKTLQESMNTLISVREFLNE